MNIYKNKQFYQKYKMSQNNSSLLGFLKKKSLFASSPDKNIKKRSRSKERIRVSNTLMTQRNQPDQQQFREEFQPQRNLKNYHSRSSKNLYKDSSTKNMQAYQVQSDIGVQPPKQQSPIRYFNPNKPERHQKQQTTKPVRRNFNFKNPEQRTPQPNRQNMVEQQQNTSITNVWASLVNHASTFESARLQSKQCLDSLSVKLQTEISNINYKIDIFHDKLTKILNSQFKNLHAQILNIIDKVFAESEANIRAFIKQKEEILAGELLQMREQLRVQYDRVQVMKEEINKPHWRKVAGELLSSQLQEKVEQMVYKSKSMDIQQWDIGDLGAGKVKALQYQLRQIVTLAT